MKQMINKNHIEGFLYEHNLDLKVSGPNSANPNTEYITGTISIAVDDDMTNIVPIHFTYVTATTKKGTPNGTYSILSDIINQNIKNYMDFGDGCAKLKVDTAISLNEFYSDRTGKEELVSAKRNEGGFVRLITTLSDDEKRRNSFECDMIITGTKTIEADPDRKLPEKLVISGSVFDFKNSVLPVQFSVVDPAAIAYFEGLEPSSKAPVFTRVKGHQVSETVTKTIEEEGAFGAPSVREITTSHKDWIVDWAQPEVYVWDDESTILASELSEAITARQVYLATIKQRSDEYKASKGTPKTASAAATAEFKF